MSLISRKHGYHDATSNCRSTNEWSAIYSAAPKASPFVPRCGQARWVNVTEKGSELLLAIWGSNNSSDPFFPSFFLVINRGVARMRIFQSDKDYDAFHRVVEQTLCVAPMRVCAYCWIPNHWHFIVAAARTVRLDRADQLAAGRNRVEGDPSWPSSRQSLWQCRLDRASGRPAWPAINASGSWSPSQELFMINHIAHITQYMRLSPLFHAGRKYRGGRRYLQFSSRRRLAKRSIARRGAESPCRPPRLRCRGKH